MAAKSFYAVEEAGRFGRNAESMGESFARPVREFLAGLPRDWTVVEIGAGQGAFDGSHPGYIATDYSFFALREYSSGKRIQADAQALPFADAAVDAFFSVATFEHIPDPARAAAELDRCLDQGGRLLLFPAWYVRPWAATALAVRPYADLSWADRLRKASIPLRNGKPYQFARVLPGRLRREILLRSGRRVPFDYRRLTPNPSEYVTTDSDAFASLDPQAVASHFCVSGIHRSRSVAPDRAHPLWLRTGAPTQADLTPSARRRGRSAERAPRLGLTRVFPTPARGPLHAVSRGLGAMIEQTQGETDRDPEQQRPREQAEIPSY